MKVLRFVVATVVMVMAFFGLNALSSLAEWQDIFLTGVIVYVWVFVLVGQSSDFSTLRKLPISFTTLPMVLLLIIIGLASITFQTEFLHWHWLEDETIYSGYQHPAYFLSDLIAAAMLAPFVEEVFFRRWMFGTLRKKLNQTISVVLVAVVFALLHGDVFGAFTFSIVMSVLYLRTRSLALPMVLHALHNGLLILFQLCLDFDLIADLEPAITRWAVDYPVFLFCVWLTAIAALWHLVIKHSPVSTSVCENSEAQGESALVECPKTA